MTKTVGIDNGHYLTTNGKRTPIFTDGTKSALTGKNFMHEWEYNRATAIYLDIELKRCGFKTVQVATDNFDTAISTRAKRAVSAKVDVLVSIHANAHNGIWGTHGGTEQLACGAESIRIAKLIQEEMVKELKLRDRGIKDGCWLGLVSNAGKIPVVLVETAFMDNLSEAKMLLDEGFRKRSAIAIAKGICRAYNVPYVAEVQPKPVQQQPVKTTTNQGGNKPMELTPTYWNIIEKTLQEQYNKGILSSDQWVVKAKNKELTNDEATMLLFAILGRNLDRLEQK